MYADCLIPLFSYPKATPEPALREALALAGSVTRHATVLTIDWEIAAPANPLAVKLLDLDALVRETRQRNKDQADRLTTAVQDVCRANALAH